MCNFIFSYFLKETTGNYIKSAFMQLADFPLSTINILQCKKLIRCDLYTYQNNKLQ